MDFERIDNALEVCKRHLDSTGVRNTEIESYLVGYVLTFAGSEFEQRFEELVNKRCARHADGALEAFMAHAADKLIRSPKVNEMTGLLGRFGPLHKEKFIEVRTDGSVTAYGQVITNRQLVSHRSGSNMTFDEAEREIKRSYAIFDAVAMALGLTTAELASFK